MSQILFHSYGNAQKVIIMLPGWKYPPEMEPKFIKLLSEKYRLVTVQLPGYWDNPDASTFLDFSELAEMILHELNTQKIVPSAWVGFSMGCKLFMEIEHCKPNIVPSIFVGCPQGKYQVPSWGRVLLTSKRIVLLLRKNPMSKKYIVRMALKTLKNHDLDQVTVTGAFDSLLGLLRSTVRPTPKTLQSLYIYGNRDRYLSIAQEKCLPNLAIIPNADHNCVRDHEPEVVALIDKALT